MNDLLFNIGALIRENGSFIYLLALLGGIVTSFSPCSVSSIPIILGVIGSDKMLKRRGIFSFILGNLLSFTLLGIISAWLGKIISFQTKGFYIFMGALMIFSSFVLLDIIPIRLGKAPKLSNHYSLFIMGVVAGLFASPCAGPIVIALMSLVVGLQISLFKSVILFILFGLGNSFLLTISALLYKDFVDNEEKQKSNKVYKFLKYLISAIFIALGLYFLYIGF